MIPSRRTRHQSMIPSRRTRHPFIKTSRSASAQKLLRRVRARRSSCSRSRHLAQPFLTKSTSPTEDISDSGSFSSLPLPLAFFDGPGSSSEGGGTRISALAYAYRAWAEARAGWEEGRAPPSSFRSGARTGFGTRDYSRVRRAEGDQALSSFRAEGAKGSGTRGCGKAGESPRSSGGGPAWPPGSS